ncbi:MAG: hypothetical protein QOI96_1335 [Verrucomicrobiota bacterium]|jgi:hypothetical protein
MHCTVDAAVFSSLQPDSLRKKIDIWPVARAAELARVDRAMFRAKFSTRRARCQYAARRDPCFSRKRSGNEGLAWH